VNCAHHSSSPLPRSTLVGDIAEVKAVKKVFTDTAHIKMNATKSLIGHCLGAAGGMEAIAVIKAIESGWLHPSLNQNNLIDEVAGINTVPNEKQQHKVGGAAVMMWRCGAGDALCVPASHGMCCVLRRALQQVMLHIWLVHWCLCYRHSELCIALSDHHMCCCTPAGDCRYLQQLRLWRPQLRVRLRSLPGVSYSQSRAQPAVGCSICIAWTCSALVLLALRHVPWQQRRQL
jgi:hypothetical protein